MSKEKQLEFLNIKGCGNVKIDNTEKVRNIEKVIDSSQQPHPVFCGTKEQVLFDLLSIFEDLCNLARICSMLNPLALRKITDYMDALN